MKITKTILSLLVLNTFFITSCDDGGGDKEIISDIVKLSANAEDTLVDMSTRVEAPAHSGKFVFRADSLHTYSAAQTFNLNDTLMNSSLRVCLDFWAKSSNPLKGDGFAVAFQTADVMISWSTLDLVYYGAKPNEWINIKDSVTIPVEMYNKPGMLFKFFGYIPSQKAVVDIDDINITVKKIEVLEED